MAGPLHYNNGSMGARPRANGRPDRQDNTFWGRDGPVDAFFLRAWAGRCFADGRGLNCWGAI